MIDCTNIHLKNDTPLHSTCAVRYTNLPVLVVNNVNSLYTSNSACASTLSASQIYSAESYQTTLADSASVSGIYDGKLII